MDKRLLTIHDAMVRKFVNELKGYENLIYEICNEPYFGGVTMEWQHHIASLISETEKGLGIRHLISQNIANNTAKIVNPHPEVSVFNFHYGSPPVAVGQNFNLNKVIGNNETGFRGKRIAPTVKKDGNLFCGRGTLQSRLFLYREYEEILRILKNNLEEEVLPFAHSLAILVRLYIRLILYA
jgi:hypothetical protein